MTAYARKGDVLPCPREDLNPAGQHDWIDSRCSSDEPFDAECSYCAALLKQEWWGWEFKTGEEHFQEAAENMPPEVRETLDRAAGRRRRGMFAQAAVRGIVANRRGVDV